MTGPIAQGKVRDIYDLGDDLLLVATDRISAYDVILPDPIPKKGQVLTELSRFWFFKTAELVPNHLITTDPEQIIEAVREAGVAVSVPSAKENACAPDAAQAAVAAATGEAWLEGRATLCRKAEVLPVECVVRGYLAGSGWKEYQASRSVCGLKLPKGLEEGARLPTPIFTPSTKAAEGHDENIDFDTVASLIGDVLADKLRDAALALYVLAHEYALAHGVIIADTKFEFGLVDGELTLIDEALTPDSSRFWPADAYEPGHAQPSFDKQYVRDWLDSSGWDHEPPGPHLPPDVIARTSAKYVDAYERLTLEPFPYR